MYWFLMFCWAIITCIPVLTHFFMSEAAGLVSLYVVRSAGEFQSLREALSLVWNTVPMLSGLMLTIVATYGFPFDGDKELSQFPGGLKDVEYYGPRFAADMQQFFIFCVILSIMISPLQSTSVGAPHGGHVTSRSETSEGIK